MLKRISVWLDAQHLKKIDAMAKDMTPGTKTSMLIRQAIAEFVERNQKPKSKK
jgi:predicted transcriptional regulator